MASATLPKNVRLGGFSATNAPCIGASLPTSDSTPDAERHLVARSRLTREECGEVFHSGPSGSTSVLDATGQATSPVLGRVRANRRPGCQSPGRRPKRIPPRSSGGLGRLEHLSGTRESGGGACHVPR